MESVGSYEAKTHLPKLLDRVAKGERIVITKHGVPVAMIVPASSCLPVNPHDLIKEIQRSRRGRRLNGLSLKRMIQEGRK